MSATPTLVAPTATQQINRYLYVGQGFLHTIQNAVDFAATHNDTRFLVVIPPGYTGADTIASIVRGGAQIWISDERNGTPSVYVWDGTKYAGPVLVPNGILINDATINLNGHHLVIEGALTTTEWFIAEQIPIAAPASTVFLGYSPGVIAGVVDAIGPDASTYGGIYLAGTLGDNSSSIDYLICKQTGCTMYPSLTVNGAANASGVITTNEWFIAKQIPETAPASTVFLGYSPGETAGVIDAIGPDAATHGGIYLAGTLGDNSSSIDYLICKPTGCTMYPSLTVNGNITADGNMDVTGHKIINVADGVNPTDAVNVSQLAGSVFVYPPPGIAVSTGTGWDESIDPGNGFLPLTLTGNTAVNTAAGSLTLGSGNGTTAPTIYLGAATPANAVKIRAASYGSTLQWSAAYYTGNTTVDLNTLAATYGSGDFTVGPRLNGPPQLADQSYIAVFAHHADANTQVQTAWNYSDTTAISRIYIRNSTSAGWTPWTQLLHDDGAGNVAVSGTLSTKATAFFTDNNLNGVVAPSNGLAITWNTKSGFARTDFINSNAGAETGSEGGFTWYSVAPGTTVTPTTPYLMELDGDGTLHLGGASLAAGVDNNLQINAPSNGTLVVNWAGGGHGVVFANGSGTQVASITQGGDVFASGNVTGRSFIAGALTIDTAVANTGRIFGTSTTPATAGGIRFEGYSSDFSRLNRYLELSDDGTTFLTQVNGTFVVNGTKNFRITHPLDDTKYLTHSSLEGPEVGVYYRGEGETDANGTATITLPDYFEALTLPEGRTVQLTEIFEDGDDSELGKLAAGRVKAGKFKVRSEFASMKFYWEVKAIRSDVAELKVETTRTEENPAVIQPIAPSVRRDDAGEEVKTGK